MAQMILSTDRNRLTDMDSTLVVAQGEEGQVELTGNLGLIDAN